MLGVPASPAQSQTDQSISQEREREKNVYNHNTITAPSYMLKVGLRLATAEVGEGPGSIPQQREFGMLIELLQ